MSLPRLRRRVEPALFDQWRAALPGLGLPAWLDADADADADAAVGPAAAVAARGVTVPPMVAAALALQGDPAVTVLFRLREATGVLVGCVALEDGVVSSLVRGTASRPAGSGEAWVEVALVPIERAVTEVLRWVPARPASRVSLEVRVVRGGRQVGSWRWRLPGHGTAGGDPGDAPGGSAAVAGGGSGGGSGGPREEVREDVRTTVTACLARCLGQPSGGPPGAAPPPDATGGASAPVAAARVERAGAGGVVPWRDAG